MFDRLTASLMRLVPAVMYQSPDNPLQLDRLPPGYEHKVELDYPVFQEPAVIAKRRAAICLFLVATATPILAWWHQYLIIPYFHVGIRFLVMLIATALIAHGALAHSWPVHAIGAAVVAAGIQATLAAELESGIAAILPFVIALAVLGDRLGLFYLHLKTACPTPRDRAQQVRALANGRFRTFKKPLRGFEFYFLGFLPILVASLFLIQQVSHKDNRSFGAAILCATLIFFGSTLWTLLVEFFVAPMFGRKSYSWRALLGAYWRALFEWLSYNRLGTQGVGIHRSPAGTYPARRNLLIGTLLLGACSWVAMVPAAPSGPLALLTRQWLEFNIGLTVVNELQRAPLDAPSSSPPPPPLEPHEQQLLSRLSTEQRESYLAERANLHAQRLREQSASRAEDVENQHVGRSIATFFASAGNAVLNLMFPAITSLAMTLGLIFAIAARPLAGIESLFGTADRKRVLDSDNWELLVNRVRSSDDELEKSSLFMGTLAKDDTPVLVPREVFYEHVHILGDSGAGKTSMGLLPLMSQLMRFGDCSVVVIDLKADDQSVFENIRHEAAEISKKSSTPYRCRWFTSLRGRSSYAFNPFSQRFMSQLAHDQKTDFFVAALGLYYGTDYGRKYFGDANYDLLSFVFESFPDTTKSFADLAEILAAAEQFPLNKETKKAATHIGTAVRRLARIPALNFVGSPGTDPAVSQHAFDFGDFFATPQAAYFALPPSAGVSTTAEIARAVLYSVLTAAQFHSGKRKQVFLVIDEFQRIVAGNLALFLQTARSMNIGVILANQSLSDLETADASLIPATRTNCRFRQVFGVGEPQEIDDIQATAGETIAGLRTFTGTPTLFGNFNLQKLTLSELPVSRLNLNEILLATDRQGRSITTVRRGDGYAQFGGMHFVMDSVFHIDPQTYSDRKKIPWPDPEPGTLVSAVDQPPPKTPSTGADVISDPTPPPPQDVTESSPTSGTPQEGHSDEDDDIDDIDFPPPPPTRPKSGRRGGKKQQGHRPGRPDLPTLGDLLE